MDQPPEEPDKQEPVTPAPRRRGRPKKVREEGVVTSNVTPRVVMPNITPQPLSTGFWMGLLTTQREMELEAKRDKYKRFSLA